MRLVILPQLGEDGKRNELHPVGEDDGLIERFSSDNLAGLLELRNKQPVWSNETESYVLNFHGRVTRVSLRISCYIFGYQLIDFISKKFNFAEHILYTKFKITKIKLNLHTAPYRDIKQNTS